MKDLGKQVDAPTTIYEENQGAIGQYLAKTAKYHSRTKHIDIRAVSNEIRVIYCRTEDMVADIMTKGRRPSNSIR